MQTKSRLLNTLAHTVRQIETLESELAAQRHEINLLAATGEDLSTAEYLLSSLDRAKVAKLLEMNSLLNSLEETSQRTAA